MLSKTGPQFLEEDKVSYAKLTVARSLLSPA